MERRDVMFMGFVAAILIIFAMRFSEIIRALFMAFLAALFAIFLFDSARRLSERFGLPKWVWVASIILLSVGFIAGVTALSGNAVASQFDELGNKIMPAFDQATDYLSQYVWGQQLLSTLAGLDFQDFMPQIQDLVGAILGALVGIVVVLVGGFFISLEPDRYRAGMMWLAPKGHERRFSDMLVRMRDRLYRWTIGRLASMAVVFVLTAVGLLIVGSPLPILLALIAGLLSFIPNFGPIASAALAALVGLSVSPSMAGWIILIFVVVQLIESNLIDPLIERRAAYLPAGLILVVQAVMGLAFGILGLLVATPLLVAVITLVKDVRDEPTTT